MHIATFAQYFDHLRQTASRNTITEILSELFAKADATEIDKICYLALGRLAPKFVPLEFQLAKKLMVRAIAKASGQTDAHVAGEFKKVGDLGDVIAKLQSASWRTNYKLKITNQTVTHVYNRLLAIAQEEGVGSVERKITQLAALLSSLDPLSAKYIVRIALGIIRLGFSDTTILDALSFMKNKDKSLRKDLEYAYNAASDIGLIARTFKEQGERGIHLMKVHPGIPIRPQQAERLPSARKIIENLGECAIEYKLDGLRCQVHVINFNPAMAGQKRQKQLLLGEEKDKKEVRIFSRNLEDTTHMFPEIVEAARALPVDSAIFDGEAIGIDPKKGTFLPFQETAQRKRKHNIAATAKKVPVKYFAFDILYLNGEDLLNKSFRERRKVLEKILK